MNKTVLIECLISEIKEPKAALQQRSVKYLSDAERKLIVNKRCTVRSSVQMFHCSATNRHNLTSYF